MAGVEFEFMKDGPMIVKKNGKMEFALCRCGHSMKKPFCSGAHAENGFKADSGKLELKD
ncbi:MAG: CDGSH iron-sulfur domain-containing protein [Candidatus Marsarchaeota archaeon]|nr:CDGSH iron-sulfur domain-containing protein [Candidatus Marsarchaeota archaeon]MCL5413241.1 CDGSH iron-sulfur domain-containing protein [Candidatus Marsarchaeota archaeon]